MASGLQPRGLAGAKGTFIVRRHNVQGLVGSGPNGEVLASDLLTVGPDGSATVIDPSRTVEEKQSRNKLTRRALGFMLKRSLDSSHYGSDFTVPEIAYNRTTDPWTAFFVAGDNPGGIPAVADLRPKFDESDGQYDDRVPVQSGIAGQGSRGVSLSTTSGTTLHRVGLTYPTTSPYREIEWTLFQQSATPSYASGSVVVPVPGTIVDGDTVTLDDGINDPVVFEYDKTGDGVTGTNTRVDITAAADADAVRDALAEAINAEQDKLYLDATTVIAATVTLTHRTGGSIGNVTTWAASGAGHTITQPTGGGGGSEGTGGGAGCDNLPIKAMGIAEGAAVGSGETNNRISARSIVGLVPQLQGIWDRIYQHEATLGTLHKYANAETLGTYGDGYVAESEVEVTYRSILPSGTDSIISGNTVIMKDGNLTQEDVGRTARFSGSSAGNDGDKTIATVVNRITFTTTEALSTEGDGFAVDIVEPNKGEAAFDGDVSVRSYGQIDLGFKWRSNTSPNQVLGRVWDSAGGTKSIRGIRIFAPQGTPKTNVLNTFKVQYLDPLKAPGGVPGDLEPFNDLHWTDIAEADYQASSQDDNIYNNGWNGYEYMFTTARTCYGIRLANATASGGAVALEIAELAIFSNPPAMTITAGVDDQLRLATNALPSPPGVAGPHGSFRTYSLGDIVVTGDASLNEMQDIADAINRQVRGYEIEAVRGVFGDLIIRSTVAGDNSQLDLDANPTLGAHVKLGLAATETNVVGTTESIRKLPAEALTIIYRVNLSGDLPVAG